MNGGIQKCRGDEINPGAGYAGGIVSAGIDGERCAEAVADYFNLIDYSPFY